MNKTNSMFKVGDKIRIIHMEDSWSGVTYAGKEGVIDHIDDRGQLWGTWGGLAVIPEIDTIMKI